jgi:hypothetical protein
MTTDHNNDSDRILEKKHRKVENKRAEKHLRNALRSGNFSAHLDDDELDDLGFNDDVILDHDY